MTVQTERHEQAATRTDEEHYVCCHNENITLCGQDASRMQWGEGEVSCVVCADLDQCDGFCPHAYGFCPEQP